MIDDLDDPYIEDMLDDDIPTTNCPKCHGSGHTVTAGEIKLEFRKPCLLLLPNRSESRMIGKIAKTIRQGINSETLAKMREYAQNYRCIMIQEANGIFTESK